jgi:hypothetical protein
MNVSDPDTTTRSNPQGASTTGATQAGPFGDQGQGSSNRETSNPGGRSQAGSSQSGPGQSGSSQADSSQGTGRRDTSSRQGGSQAGASQSGASQSGDRQERGREEGSGLPSADRLLDELMPEQVEWETLVRRYPKPALLAAAGLGFYIALQRGPTLVAAFSGFAAQEMTRRVNDFLGSDVV